MNPIIVTVDPNSNLSSSITPLMTTETAGLVTTLPSVFPSPSNSPTVSPTSGISNADGSPAQEPIHRSFGLKPVEDGTDHEKDIDEEMGLAPAGSVFSVPNLSNCKTEEDIPMPDMKPAATTLEMMPIDGMEGFSTCTYDDDKTDENVCPICLGSYG